CPASLWSSDLKKICLIAHLESLISKQAVENDLETLRAKNSMDVNAHPALALALHIDTLSRTINYQNLLRDLRAWERLGYQQLAKTKYEQELIGRWWRLELTQKLVDFALTPDEWTEWTNAPKPDEHMLFPFFYRPGFLQSFENFYREADMRN